MTHITEILPDDASESTIEAMAEGRLCRYAGELEVKVERLTFNLKVQSKYATEYRAAMESSAKQVRHIAFSMPAPNKWTPQLAQLANSMISEVSADD